MRHTKKKILPFVFASGLLATSLAQAAQLGKLEVLSGAGEPFLAEIQVDLVLPEERASLQAKLASAEAFKAARLTMDPNLKDLQFSVQNGSQPGKALVKITSVQPLPPGFIDTLVELTWAGGRVAREYTLTVPVGVAKAAEPVTSLPEIRPPMTPPPAAAEPQASAAPTPKAFEKPAPRAVPEGAMNVQRGDTLSELAMQLVGDGVSLNQAMAALYEANKDSFINGSVHLIREGAQIQVPNRAALRTRNTNEALLILAQNDDRNVYSAYARQIGLLTVEKQVAANGSTSSQGNITPQNQASEVNAAAPSDRLQIAPGASPGAGATDANAEELVAKNKALAEANERIALLEKNVSDLQRLLDMQQDIGDTKAGASAEVAGVPADTPAESSTTETPLVGTPSDTLGEENAAEDAEPVPSEVAADEGVQAPVAEVPVEDPPFDWMPWILAGAGGLVVLVVLLLIARSRRNKAEDEKNEGFGTEDNSSFSEVNEFDEAIASASAGSAAERAAGLNRAENSDFDLDDVLNDRLKQANPGEVTQLKPSPLPEPRADAVNDIPELKNASDEALQQKDSLNSDVTLDFPEDGAGVAKPNPNSILDDLDEIEKGTLAAQEELDAIRKQPATERNSVDDEIASAFNDLIDSNPAEKDQNIDSESTGSKESETTEIPEEAFDRALVDLDVDVPNPKVDDATWQEVATKLDLAGAYVEIGDADGAKELLNEIVKKGDVDQVRKAKALLATLN